MQKLFPDEFHSQYFKGKGNGAKKYYVVFIGRNPGIYDNWADVKKQTDKFLGNLHQKYNSYMEAKIALRKWLDQNKDRKENV